ALFFEQLLSLRHEFVQQAGVLFADLAKLEIWTLLQGRQRFENIDYFQLQRLVQPTQLREFHSIAEVQTGPALAQNESMRVLRDLPQRFDVAVVFGPIDGGGELL